jgi:hypothetical protein
MTRTWIAETGAVEQELGAEGCIEYEAEDCNGIMTVPVGGVGYSMRYWRNFALGNPPSSITNAVIVIHGADRNPWNYFGAALDAARKEGLAAQTIVVAPWFAQYYPYNEPQITNPLCWNGGGWPEGDPSSCSAGVSSYQVVDQIVARLRDRTLYPNLRRITFAGHSAGGQFVQRYAMIGAGIQWQATGVTYRYVVANPSSYAYLGPERELGTYFPVWGVPTRCPDGSDPTTTLAGYDHWRYGVDRTGEIPYVRQYSDAIVRSTYQTRSVVYLAGELDVNTKDGFDDTCAAMVQGPTRRSRAYRYFAHMERLFPNHRHQVRTVPYARHSVWDMLPSETGRQAMFD